MTDTNVYPPEHVTCLSCGRILTPYKGKVPPRYLPGDFDVSEVIEIFKRSVIANLQWWQTQLLAAEDLIEQGDEWKDWSDGKRISTVSITEQTLGEAIQQWLEDEKGIDIPDRYLDWIDTDKLAQHLIWSGQFSITKRHL